MSETKFVWVIEQGEYSDYKVIGVYSSAEAAQLVADAINAAKDGHDEATVDQWPLDPAVEELRAGHRQHIVHMLRNGDVERCEAYPVSGYEISGSVRIWERTKAPAYKGKDVQDCLQATVWAKDDAHAIKIVNEKRAQMIVAGEW